MESRKGSVQENSNTEGKHMNKEQRIITIDWRSVESIANIERQKLRLENAGWTLVASTERKLTYERRLKPPTATRRTVK